MQTKEELMKELKILSRRKRLLTNRLVKVTLERDLIEIEYKDACHRLGHGLYLDPDTGLPHRETAAPNKEDNA
jgi:hypothetical protein